MIGNELWSQLPVSPDSYIQKLDPGRGLALAIDVGSESYRAASFLDDRMLTPTTRGSWLPIARVSEAARRIADPRPLHFIFHTGHVGSTLVSRLLDETGAVLPIREPLPLRTLADAHDRLGLPGAPMGDAPFHDALGMMLRLWSRGYDWTRAVVVKATSSAGRLAIPLLEMRPQARAICLNLGAEAYLATLLAGANSAQDLRGHGPGRLQRLAARTVVPLRPLDEFSLGELAALGWLVETASQQDALHRFPDRLLAIDFDDFLAQVAPWMERILAHLKLPRDAHYLAAIAASPVLRRYSKAPELPWSPADRDLLMRESRRNNRAEIDRGRDWLDGIARADERLATVIARAGRAA